MVCVKFLLTQSRCLGLFIMGPTELLPQATGPDARPPFWVETSRTGDIWLLAKEGALVARALATLPRLLLQCLAN